jgi:hypothetical protein
MPVIAFVAVLGSSIQAQYDAVASADSFHPEVRAVRIRQLEMAEKEKALADQAAWRRACALTK